MDVWAATDEERGVLADDLAGLVPSQWDVPSLCTEWKVRDVVGHLVVESDPKVGRFLLGVARHRLNVDGYLAREAIDAGHGSPGELLAGLRATIGMHAVLPFTKPECVLADVVCHGQDVRRPLGLHRVVPPDRLVASAEFLRRDRFSGTKRRIAGLRLVAADAEWRCGDGPEVRGPMMALVMVMAGRSAAVDDLAGPGLGVLRERLT